MEEAAAAPAAASAAAPQDSEPSQQSSSTASAAASPPNLHPFQQPPLGLTPSEYASLSPTIEAYHTYHLGADRRCSSLLSQRIRCPASFVWSVVKRFDCPQIYKHFIRSCAIKGGGGVEVGCLRELSVISGLPASTSTERLDILDEDRKITGFTIIGGEHRLRNYKSVTSVNQFEEGDEIWTVVLESYVVDVPEGNSEEDTRLFADTVIKLNLQKLKSVAEAAAAKARQS